MAKARLDLAERRLGNAEAEAAKAEAFAPGNHQVRGCLDWALGLGNNEENRGGRGGGRGIGEEHWLLSLLQRGH